MKTPRQDLRRRLTAIAGAQAGYFTAAQALAAGYTYQTQKYHADRGNWTKVDRGIFRISEWPSSAHEQLVRWALWSHGKGVISHGTALAVHELGDVNPAKIHLTVSASFRTRSSMIVLHKGTLEAPDVCEHEGYSVTAPARTLADVADDDLDASLLAGAIEDALDRGLVTSHGLRQSAETVSDHAALRVERALSTSLRAQQVSFAVEPTRTTVPAMSFEPMTISRLGALVAGAPDVEHRRLFFSEFLEEYEQEARPSRRRLFADEPAPTGLPEWDALLAGLAEHLAATDGTAASAWVEQQSRFLDEPWCYFDLPFFRAEAKRETPEAFARHGVLIRAVELERV